MNRITRGPRKIVAPLVAVAAMLVGVIAAQSNGVAYDRTVATQSPCPSPEPSSSESPLPTPTVPSESPEATSSPSPSAPCNPANLQARGVPPVLTWGNTYKVQGTLSCENVAVANARIVIIQHAVGSSSSTTYATSTDDRGAYEWSDKPSVKTDYKVAWGGTGDCPDGALAPTLVAQVRPGVILNVVKPVVAPGTRADFAGQVVPAHPGVRVTLQMLQGASTKSWHTVAGATLDSRSKFKMGYFSECNCYGLFRAVFTGDADHYWNVSRSVRVDWRR